MSMKYKRHTVATLIDILSRFDDDMPIWIYTKEGAHPLFKVVDGSPEDHIAILVDYEKKNFEFKTTHSENEAELENAIFKVLYCGLRWPTGIVTFKKVAVL